MDDSTIFGRLRAGGSVVQIVATDGRGGMARDGVIPWDCPGDRAFFREATMGCSVIFGRRTYETLPPGGLPGRRLFVLTSQTPPRSTWLAGVTAMDSPAALLDAARRNTSCVFIGGGADIYRVFMPCSTDILRTRIPGDHACTLFYPDIPDSFALCERLDRTGFRLEWWHRL